MHCALIVLLFSAWGIKVGMHPYVRDVLGASSSLRRIQLYPTSSVVELTVTIRQSTQDQHE